MIIPPANLKKQSDHARISFIKIHIAGGLILEEQLIALYKDIRQISDNLNLST